MSRKRLLAVASAGVAALVLAGLGWWLRAGDPAGDAADREARSVAHRSAPRPGGAKGVPRWLGQTGALPRPIAGRVTYAGAPVAGATVHLELPRDLRTLMPLTVVTTGPDGTFDFGTQIPTAFLVMASAPGRAPDGARVDLRDPTRAPPPDRLELVLADCAQTVYGTVHDHGGPIAGASVRVATHEESIAIGTTGADGRYELCVGPGGGAMRVAADGYASVEIEVTGGKRLRRDVELSPEALVTGIVLGPDDQPVAGAFVHAAPTEGNPLVTGSSSSGLTDADGRFSLGGLAPGRYSLSARDEGRRAAETVDVVASVGGSEDVTLRLVPMVTVRGRIIENGKPVAGARIAQRTERFLGVDRSIVPVAQAVSQADGGFVLDAVPPGTFAIAVKDYEVLAPHTVDAVAPDTEVTVEVASKARVSGRVTRDGKPVAGAQVTMIGGNHAWGGSAKTKADGVFELGGISPGTYYIEAQSQSAFARRKTITVEKQQHLTGVDIELDLGAEIAGVVVDQRGAPVAGVSVVFELPPRRDWGFATTGEDGTFVAAAMSGGGTYTASVKSSRNAPTGFAPAPGTTLPRVHLADGNSRAEGIRIAVQLDRKQIRGVVVSADGKPAADIKVSAFPPPAVSSMLGFSPPAAEVMTGGDGTFLLRDLMTGSYAVRARAGSGVEVIQDVVAGQDNVRLTLPATGTVEGRLVGFGRSVRVSAASRGLDRLSARVDGDRFTIAGIPPGSYTVSAREGARSDESEVEVEAGRTASVTLTAKGTVTVFGRVVNLATREPLAGIQCDVALARDGSEPGAVTGAAGEFRLLVPAGGWHRIHCGGLVGAARAMGDGEVDASRGASREILIEAVVTRVPWRDRGDLGLSLMPGPPATMLKVTPGGPAERAGVKVGDAVIKVDGVAVDKLESAQVLRLMEDHAVGEKLNLGLRRDGREIAVSIEVAAAKRD